MTNNLPWDRSDAESQILSQFPDLDALKKRIAEGRKRGGGWRNVVLNVKAQKEVYRPDIDGTLTIFSNLHGESVCVADGKRVRIEEQYYFLLNNRQDFTLEVEPPRHKALAAETFNIHFGTNTLEQVYTSLVTSSDCILTGAQDAPTTSIHFFNKLYRKDADFVRLIEQFRTMQQRSFIEKNPIAALPIEELFTEVLQYLLVQHKNVLREIHSLPALKSSTRAELYRRLSFALDYIHTHYARQMELDELASAAMLSKFHFLRLFKTAFKQTPHQYITALRLERAQNLLRKTPIPIGDVALLCGFENFSSFSRLFQQRLRVTPQRFRLSL